MFHYYYILQKKITKKFTKHITTKNKPHNYLKILIIREYINLLLLYKIYILKCTYIFYHILFIILTIWN